MLDTSCKGSILFCTFAGWYEERVNIKSRANAGDMVLIECHRF